MVEVREARRGRPSAAENCLADRRREAGAAPGIVIVSVLMFVVLCL